MKDAKDKKKGGMKEAVNNTEKIRAWDEHTMEIYELAKRLDTTIKRDPADTTYQGLGDI